ncbi:Mitochondrial Enoyl-ACP Synthase [Klebsormidium nitens]|uniref:Enoyl-[acyl-carrier-protein] reductase, mitochondrial n=1 Tax=Klebsormidium nitens TaxID=105231 RepID=A0A1Y1IFE2_KLENI|nr:Mitochondrial Enoyl-ACP Synthase [Klebsormidium nitens]|eukprot:GAQ87447.1 Mitochondrial Enoyl-ACP Synthase [Klebsormidium nitens]
MATVATTVVFDQHGPPDRVLRQDQMPLKPPEDNEVEVDMLAAPINPSDINLVEGTYGIKPDLPAVAGLEGVGRVTKVGPAVTSLAVSDWVIPASTGKAFGTWRTAAVCAAEDLLKVRSDAPVEYAATVAVNPCTAYRMLEDFAHLEEGDVVVQNGATSMVGLAVIQLARERGLHSVNIIRDRPNFEEKAAELKALGASVVLTEERAQSPEGKQAMKGFPPAKLGLNCVGGSAATAVTKLLGTGATLVTYGGMSMKPVTISTSYFIFKDITCKGFWVSRWAQEHSAEERSKMIDYLLGLARDKKLTFNFEKTPFTDFDFALKKALGKEGFTAGKQLLVFK